MTTKTLHNARVYAKLLSFSCIVMAACGTDANNTAKRQCVSQQDCITGYVCSANYTCVAQASPNDAANPETFSHAAMNVICDSLLDGIKIGDDTASYQIALGDKSRCLSFAPEKKTLSAIRSRLQTIIDSGKGQWSNEAVRQCLDKIAQSGDINISIREAIEQFAICREMIEGTVAVGESCSDSYECKGDAFCNAAKCTARRQAGASCERDDECEASSLGIAQCYALEERYKKICVKPEFSSAANEGEACGIERFSSRSALKTTPCAQGLWCSVARKTNGDIEDQGVCKKPIAANEKCTLRDACVHGHICRCPGESGFDCETTDPICQPVTIQHKEGAACEPGSLEAVSRSFCDPFDRLVCEERHCKKLSGDGSNGDPCRNLTDNLPFCRDDLVCHPETLTCG